MFDWIKRFDAKCPECNENFSAEGFQSKDGDCRLDSLNYWEVDTFYGDCPHCKSWIEFKKFKDMNVLDNYKIVPEDELPTWHRRTKQEKDTSK